MGLSIKQLMFGVGLLIVGLIGKNCCTNDKIKEFFKKVKTQGIFNIILGIISVIIQYLNEELFIISIFMLVIGTFFSFIYLLISCLLLIKYGNLNKSSKIGIFMVVVSFCTYIFFGDAIADKLKIGFTKLDEPIKIGKEFLLYECNDESHGDEKVYMTINKIEKDNSKATMMYFDLRYEGDESINLVDENNSFSDLSSFRTTISCDRLEDDYDEFLIEDDINNPVIYSEYVKNLPKVVEPKMTLRNLVYPIAVEGTLYDDISLEDMNIEIETALKMQHEGKSIRENIDK
ncbi:MAG TPA: hypothetical protein DDY58_15365 [Terrisporobacter glycolicus]|uniref:hypothetical protein n=1 Tax=Terrisporobacter TaxID=1505652 RepID=UPI000E91C6E3|nr:MULTISPECIES: hypothetical protein [Terrisporobacter]HBI93676.1 hypothetical protein [Terrisporobacter hibernicus]